MISFQLVVRGTRSVFLCPETSRLGPNKPSPNLAEILMILAIRPGNMKDEWHANPINLNIDPVPDYRWGEITVRYNLRR
jgi:hypothetical protein